MTTTDHVHDLGMPADGPIADAIEASVATQGAKQTELKAKDLKTDQEVRWCPGCGDYVILNAVQSFLPTLGIAREDMVIISGIGCSSRFLVDAIAYNQVRGLPFTAAELETVFEEVVKNA